MLIGRIDPGKQIRDAMIHTSTARKSEPWYRHREKRKKVIPLKEKIIILVIAITIIALAIVGWSLIIIWL